MSNYNYVKSKEMKIGYKLPFSEKETFLIFYELIVMHSKIYGFALLVEFGPWLRTNALLKNFRQQCIFFKYTIVLSLIFFVYFGISVAKSEFSIIEKSAISIL